MKKSTLKKLIKEELKKVLENYDSNRRLKEPYIINSMTGEAITTYEEAVNLALNFYKDLPSEAKSKFIKGLQNVVTTGPNEEESEEDVEIAKEVLKRLNNEKINIKKTY